MVEVKLKSEYDQMFPMQTGVLDLQQKGRRKADKNP